MNMIFKIFKNDLRSIAKSKMAMLIIFGLIFIPGIYAWLNIDSNWEPYDNTKNIPIAVVNEDQGATIVHENVNVGTRIKENLEQNDAMKWVFTDKTDAMQGVEQSTYYGAIVIPENFSQDLTTIFDGTEPKKPVFDFYINNKKNPIAPIIVSKAAGAIEDSANQAFVNTLVYKIADTAKEIGLITKGTEGANNLITKLEDTKAKVGQLRSIINTAGLAADATSKSLSALQAIIPTLETFNNSAEQSLGNAQNTLNRLHDKSDLPNVQPLIEQISAQIAEIEEIQGTLDRTLPAVGELNGVKEKLQEITNHLAALGNQFKSATDAKLDQIYQNTSSAIGGATDMIHSIDSSLSSIKTSMTYLVQALNSTNVLGSNIDAILADFQNDLGRTVASIRAIQENEIYQDVLRLLQNSPDVIADFLSTPVESNEIQVYPVSSYGSEMAPFYSVLACWVGCTLLTAIIKIDIKKNRTIAKAKNYQKFFGRFLLFGGLAMTQGLVIGIGDLIMQVQTINWSLFLLTLMLSSLVFVLILYALAAAFGKIGQALAIVLMVLQVAGSGGTFPIELLPRLFQILQPFMPFYPSMNAVRETVGGFYQNDYAMYMLMLLAHFIVALAFGLIFSKHTFETKGKIQKGLHATGLIG